MLVYVLNKNGNPLMPCKPAKARKLLRKGKALVVNRCPFTIQLLWDCEEQLQPITVGIDKGSHTTGFCTVSNGQILTFCRRSPPLILRVMRVESVGDECDSIRNKNWEGLKSVSNFFNPQSTIRNPQSFNVL